MLYFFFTYSVYNLSTDLQYSSSTNVKQNDKATSVSIIHLASWQLDMPYFT